jgi:hypothetical protein
VAAGKAEKAATALAAASAAPESPDAKNHQKAALKELEESVVSLLHNRVEYNRLVSHLEAKLQGREEEMANLQHYVRSQPTLGTRKHHGTPTKSVGSEPL